jgi:class 3 adenylate cyclase
MSSEIERVETILTFWQDAHRQLAAEYRGAVRVVVADAFLMTFDTTTDAVFAWRHLRRVTEDYNRTSDRGIQLRFSADLGFGDIRVFRSAVFGVAANHASVAERCSRAIDGFPLVVGEDISGSLPAELSEQLEIEPIEGRIREWPAHGSLVPTRMRLVRDREKTA